MTCRPRRPPKPRASSRLTRMRTWSAWFAPRASMSARVRAAARAIVARRPPDVCDAALVGAPRARPERFLPRLRADAAGAPRIVACDRLRAARAPGGGHGAGGQGSAVRLPHVRPVRAEL